MDSFKEQIVKKTQSNNDKVTCLFIRIASVALALSFVFLGLTLTKYAVICVFVGCMVIYGGIVLCRRFNIEYEYIFTNGEVDVDKIVAESTRKRLVTVRFAGASAFGECGDNFSVDESRTLVMASQNSAENKDYYVDFTHKNLGETTLVFTPDEDMLELINASLPRAIRK